MTSNISSAAVPAAVQSRGLNITLWVAQVTMALFFAIGSAAPKLFGQQYAVDIFSDIGAGQWLRYLVGALELAGAIGLLVARLSGLAAIGLTLLMIGAAYTQVVVLDAPEVVVTPVVLGIVAALIAAGRRRQTRALFARS